MTQLAAVYDSYTDNSGREDLHDIITNLTPSETPFQSNIGERTVKATNPEWQIDELETPNADAAQVEGAAYDFQSIDATDRVKNYTQIFTEAWRISDTQETVDKAGKKSEMAYQKMRKMKKLKIDIETAMLSNQASVAGSGATARKLGGLRAWTASNDSMGGSGASGGYNSGTGAVDAATDGTKRALTKALMDGVIQDAYVAGGNPSMLMGSPYLKQVFSTFMSDSNVAQQRSKADGKGQVTIVGAADEYLSDFGLMSFVTNRQMIRTPALARNLFVIEPAKLKKGWLRKVQEDKDVARTGDAEPCAIKGEVTLINLNEAAHGVVADLNGVDASS